MVCSRKCKYEKKEENDLFLKKEKTYFEKLLYQMKVFFY